MNAGMTYNEDELLQNVFHKGKYLVTFKRNADSKREISLIIEKIYQHDCLKITLSDDDDPCFLCILAVTRGDYEELKRHQGLLVDFDNFPSQLLRLLQQTSTGNIFLVLQNSNPLQMHLEFIEHNEFKRLVHLSLKTSPASENDLKKNMAESILNLKKIISNLKSKNCSSDATWTEKYQSMERKNYELTLSLEKLEENIRRKESECQEQIRIEKERHMQDKHDLQRAADSSLKSQVSSLQEVVNRKERQIDDLNNRCLNHQDTIRSLELQSSDRNQRIQQLEKQVQICSADLDIFKGKCSSLESLLQDKDKSLQLMRQKNQDVDKSLKDKIEKLDELYDLIQSLKREKIMIEEKLSQAESLSAKHNMAVQSQTEQLLKANQIIAKQNSDLVELKEKLMCRTAIALEQEKVIEKNATQMTDQLEAITQLSSQTEKLKEEIERLKGDLGTSESLVKEKDEIIKNNNLVIQWLQKKVDGRLGSIGDVLEPHITKTNRNFSSSAPFLTTIRQFDSSRSKKENNPEPMVNFYDTENYSPEIKQNGHQSPDFSSRSEENTAVSKFSLDPKYFRPTNDKLSKESQEDKAIPTDRSLKSSLSNKSSLKSGRVTAERDGIPHVKFSQKSTASTRRSQDSTRSRDPFPISAYFPPK